MNPQDFDWKIYKTSVDVLRGAIQQLDLVPLEDMQVFLKKSIEATVPDNELPKRKIKAAKHQLELIAISMHFMSEVRELLEQSED